MSTKKKSRRVRRKFTAEFKADVVRMCQAGNETIAEICRRLDLPDNAVRKWAKQKEVDRAGGTADALTTSEREELTRIRRELKQVKLEREILKKATAFFAREIS